jgi:uncharacterized protein YkwD
MAQIAAEVQKIALSLSAPSPLRDGRLDLVATDIARATVGKKLPSFDALAFLVRHYGLVEPEPHLMMMLGSSNAVATLVSDVAKQIPQAFRMGDWRRMGVGVKRGEGEVVVVLALQPQDLELAPLPRRLPSQGKVLVIGRLLGRFTKPAVLVATPQGSVRNLALMARKGRFELMLACDAGDGVYQVEIEGEDSRGPAVLANFPVYCGVQPPTGIATGGQDPSRRVDPDEAERELLILINRDRVAAGLDPVERDARLQAVARGHSREMARTGEVAHVSAKSGEAADRVRAAGVSPLPVFLAENVGRAFTTREVETAFMGSPGHRANILNSDMTHVGIGVAAGHTEGGDAPLFFTQLFAAW